jgi:hypothetical protein
MQPVDMRCDVCGATRRSRRAPRTRFLRALGVDRWDWSLWSELAEPSSGGSSERPLAVAAGLNPRSPEVAALRSGRLTMKAAAQVFRAAGLNERRRHGSREAKGGK